MVSVMQTLEGEGANEMKREMLNGMSLGGIILPEILPQ